MATQFMGITKHVFLAVTLYAAMILVLTACASGGGQRLTIDTRHVTAVGYLPDEVTAMLDDLGYEAMPESDAARRAQNHERYKVTYQARDAANIRIDVEFGLADKITGMHLYNTEEKPPGAATLQRYNRLKARVQQEFGADSVK